MEKGDMTNIEADVLRLLNDPEFSTLVDRRPGDHVDVTMGGVALRITLVEKTTTSVTLHASMTGRPAPPPR